MTVSVSIKWSWFNVIIACLILYDSNSYPQYPLPKNPRVPYPNHWDEEDDADYAEEALELRHMHDKKKQRKHMEFMMSVGWGNMYFWVLWNAICCLSNVVWRYNYWKSCYCMRFESFSCSLCRLTIRNHFLCTKTSWWYYIYTPRVLYGRINVPVVLQCCM